MDGLDPARVDGPRLLRAVTMASTYAPVGVEPGVRTTAARGRRCHRPDGAGRRLGLGGWRVSPPRRSNRVRLRRRVKVRRIRLRGR